MGVPARQSLTGGYFLPRAPSNGAAKWPRSDPDNEMITAEQKRFALSRPTFPGRAFSCPPLGYRASISRAAKARKRSTDFTPGALSTPLLTSMQAAPL